MSETGGETSLPLPEGMGDGAWQQGILRGEEPDGWERAYGQQLPALQSPCPDPSRRPWRVGDPGSEAGLHSPRTLLSPWGSANMVGHLLLSCSAREPVLGCVQWAHARDAFLTGRWPSEWQKSVLSASYGCGGN